MLALPEVVLCVSMPEEKTENGMAYWCRRAETLKGVDSPEQT